MKHPKKILVGLSGGVDSAVTALLLKEQGHEIAGCYMQNWMAEKDDPYCSAEQDLSDAKRVCDQLDIPFHLVNFSKEYWDNVFQHCLDEFVAGRTPNPDIGCNQYIKFDVFLKHARALGFDYLATGHYAQIKKIGAYFQLQKAIDTNKDQTYFLYTLTQERLSQALFPLGELTKPEVRILAKKAGLLNAEKKDSTGICFIGERKFKSFLQDYILTKPGNIKTVDGKIIGKHEGLMFYTLGQRKGLQIGGIKTEDQKPWFVIAKNIPQNELIVGQGQDHPLLYASELYCENLQWVSGESPDTLQCTAKTRYRQSDQTCHIKKIDKDRYHVAFESPQRAITPGQSIVFYDQTVCLGGGIISGSDTLSDKDLAST